MSISAKMHMAYIWINPTSERVHWVNDHEHAYDPQPKSRGPDGTTVRPARFCGVRASGGRGRRRFCGGLWRFLVGRRG
ncbi:hypothetical protein C1I98_02070 [Spongiactinospora gelatinilytica]|uniref:Uncharacterized protein n=1 Tax=Spongiactinospora gelatinilytica TaxID=2666298 RepID=A0A2W2H5Z2_9ACTN|nr:hypothetical protein C1I98_02070 [Spongiactinospora gelatinilytica]